MATYRSSISKRSRRLGIILGKDKSVRRRSYPPGVHGPKHSAQRIRLSSYGEQLREKQKAKAIYGVLERQFANYVKKASHAGGNTADHLVRSLEQRLDNVIYRLGWSKTRRQARQMVSHGFIQVNDKRVDIPSFRVSVGDVLSIKPSKHEKGIVKKISEILNERTLPSWIVREEETLTGRVTSLPEGEALKQDFDPTLIVEFYSR